MRLLVCTQHYLTSQVDIMLHISDAKLALMQPLLTRWWGSPSCSTVLTVGSSWRLICVLIYLCRDHFVYASSHWKTTYNVTSSYTKWCLFWGTWYKFHTLASIIVWFLFNWLRLSDKCRCQQSGLSLIQIMACHLSGTKLLFESMLKHC